mgnify:CR=1 FL=1
MYKSKLIELLKALKPQEKEALKKWISSPLHIQHKKSINLLKILLSKRLLTKRTTDRHRLYQQLYPQKTYHDPTLKHLMNYCVQSIEDFIEFSMQNEVQFFRKKMLLKFYTTRKLDKYTQQTIQKLQKKQDHQNILNSNYFYNQFELEKIIFEQQNIANRIEETNLQPIFDNHYIAFILETLSYACEALMHQRLYDSSYNIHLLDSILENIKKGQFAAIPAVQFYFHSYMCLKFPKEEYHFRTLQELLIQYPSILPPKEIKSIYLMAINYCVRQLNGGAEKYVRSVFELYQYGLEHTILIENKLLSRFTYKNIVSASIRLKEYKWTVQFIEEHTPFLEKTYQKPYSMYAKAKLHFAQGDFNSTLELLGQVEFDHLFLSLDTKTMLLKIYYERNDINALMALLVSFRRLLQRKTVFAFHREIYKNIIVLTEKLLAVPLNDTVKITALREEIEQTNPLTEKPWLLAQLNRLQ